LLGIDIEEKDMDTLGGWMLTQNFDLEKGDSLVYGGYTFKVLDIEEHHIKRIEVFQNSDALQEKG